jgi:hypothetical protein
MGLIMTIELVLFVCAIVIFIALFVYWYKIEPVAPYQEPTEPVAKEDIQAAWPFPTSKKP